MNSKNNRKMMENYFRDDKKDEKNNDKNNDKKDEKNNDKNDKKDEKTNYNIFQEKQLEVADLLELLQGPCPIDGSIIIATTNKLDEMKVICPALFRPGRLTPIEIGHISWKYLQELSVYYFGQELSFTPCNITISTSEIIELANACKLFGLGDKFELFQNKLRELLHA